jgi:hypothetical protein
MDRPTTDRGRQAVSEGLAFLLLVVAVGAILLYVLRRGPK